LRVVEALFPASRLSLSLERERNNWKYFFFPGWAVFVLFLFFVFYSGFTTRNKNDEGGYSRDSKNQNNKKKAKQSILRKKKPTNQQKTDRSKNEILFFSLFFFFSLSFSRDFILFLFVLCLFVIFF
jgi:uncharacterized membrane protein